MTAIQTDFLAEGRTRKLRGLAVVECANAQWVRHARTMAHFLATRKGTVTIDDLRKTLSEPKSPNAWGAIFKGRTWKRVGFAQSEHPSNHARIVSVWKPVE